VPWLPLALSLRDFLSDICLRLIQGRVLRVGVAGLGRGLVDHLLASVHLQGFVQNLSWLCIAGSRGLVEALDLTAVLRPPHNLLSVETFRRD